MFHVSVKYLFEDQKQRSKKHQKLYNQNPILKVDKLYFSYNKKLVLNVIVNLLITSLNT